MRALILRGHCVKCATVIPKTRRYCDACRPPSKYGNKTVHDDGIKFDSKAEHRRYLELKTLLAAGKICDLEVHPKRKLIVDGVSVGSYRPDFVYMDAERGLVVEDVKGGPLTGDFRLRAALFEAIYRVPVTIIRR